MTTQVGSHGSMVYNPKSNSASSLDDAVNTKQSRTASVAMQSGLNSAPMPRRTPAEARKFEEKIKAKIEEDKKENTKPLSHSQELACEYYSSKTRDLGNTRFFSGDWR